MSSALSQSAAARSERRIALVRPSDASGEDPATHAIQLFDSVLWVFRGTADCNWLTAAPEQADVVVLHHAEPSSTVERWRRAGKLLVIVSTDRAHKTDQPRVLHYPFPAAQVLGMLEQLDIELSGAAPVQLAPRVAPVGKEAGDAWSFVEMLRTLRSASNPELWLMGKSKGRALWLRGDGACYACDDATAAAACSGEMALHTIAPHKSTAPAAAFGKRSGAELAWWAAYHAAPTPAPWLNIGARYRLTQWPDFGRIRSRSAEVRAAQLRVVAALDAAPLAPGHIAALARVSAEQAIRTCNALVACGFAEPTEVAKPARTQQGAPAPAGGLRQFLRNLRSHLRMGAG